MGMSLTCHSFTHKSVKTFANGNTIARDGKRDVMHSKVSTSRERRSDKIARSQESHAIPDATGNSDRKDA
jgi:hypothetical protein